MPRLALLAALACVCACQEPPLAAGHVDWSARLAPLTNLSFGMNAYQGPDPGVAGRGGSPAYKQHVSDMLAGRGLVRIHNSHLMAGPATANAYAWLAIDAAQGDPVAAVAWNYTRVAAALTDTFWGGGSGDTSLMLTLSGFPPVWANATAAATLNSTLEPAWTALATELVRFVTANLSVSLPFVEVTNEWDQPYAAINNTLGLARLITRTANAIRGVSPSTKVGGPAWARPDIVDNVAPFINATLGSLDFYSFHFYATDSTNTSNTTVYDSALNAFIEPQLRSIISNLSNGTQDIMIMQDESNISWNPPDRRMTDIVGAIFDALWISSATTANATSVARWNEADGWYGACNNDVNWTPRPAAFVWQLFNTLAWGHVTASAVSPPSAQLATFASHGVVNGADRLLLVLINYSGAPAQMVLSFANWPGGVAPPPSTSVTQYAIDNDGMTQGNTTLTALLVPEGIPLPTDTIMFFDVHV